MFPAYKKAKLTDIYCKIIRSPLDIITILEVGWASVLHPTKKLDTFIDIGTCMTDNFLWEKVSSYCSSMIRNDRQCQIISYYFITIEKG